MQYDAWNNLTRLDGDREQIFQYDAAGRMIRIGEVDGSLVRWRDLWHAGDQVILESTNNIEDEPVARKHYVYAPDGRITRRLRDSNSDGTLDETLYALHDAEGSVIAVSDGTGGIVQQFIYNIDGGVTGLTNRRIDHTWLADHDWRHLWRQMRLADTSAAHTPAPQTYVVYTDGSGQFYAPGSARWLQPAGPGGTATPGFWGFFWPAFGANVGNNLLAIGHAVIDPDSVLQAISKNYDRYAKMGIGWWNATVLQFNPLTGLAEGIEGRSYQTDDFGKHIDTWDRWERGIISTVNTAATVVGGTAAWRMLSAARPPSITTLVGRNSPQRAVLLQHVREMRANVRALRAAGAHPNAVRNAVQEIKGVVYGARRMMAEGYELLAANLHHTGNQGIDLVFRKGVTYAVLEAKAIKGGGLLTALGKRKSGLTPGSQAWIRNGLQKFIDEFAANPTRAADIALARTLQVEHFAGRLRSFASFYGNRRLYQLPQLWTGPGKGPPPVLTLR